MAYGKKFRSFQVLTAIMIVGMFFGLSRLTTVPEVLSQSSLGKLRCISVKELQRESRWVECRIESTASVHFSVSELTLPFKVTKLERISSSYSPLVGSLYPSEVLEDTIVMSALNLGNEVSPPDFDFIPFDGLSFLIEVGESMSSVKSNIPGTIPLYYLEQNGSDTDFATGLLDVEFDYNTSFFRGVFTQNAAKIGVFQFIKLGTACFDKSAQDCVTNLIEGL